MKKIKLFLYIIALSFIGIQTTHWATFNVNGSILDSKNEKVDNIKINFVNKTTNKNDCEVEVKQWILNWICDFTVQDLHRTYDIVFSNYNNTWEIYKTSIRGNINKNTITIGNDITNNISIKLNVDEKWVRTTQLLKENKVNEETATLEIKGINKNISIIINWQEVNYSPNTKHTITGKNNRLEIKIPEYDINKVMELVNGKEMTIDISKMVKLKEEKADLIFHSRDISQLHSDLQKESINIVGNWDMDQKYRIDLKPEQIIHDGDKTIAKDICILSYCPKYIPYNQSIYALDLERSQYIEIKELNKQVEELNKQENQSEKKNNVLFITLLIWSLITIATTIFFLIKLIKKKRKE